MSARSRICVLGAGISGLSTAVQIQNTGLDAEIFIIADKFLHETTSAAAAGLWCPYLVGDTPVQRQKCWADTTFHHLKELYMSDSCGESGVTQMSGYIVFKEENLKYSDLNPFWRNTVWNFRVLSSEDLAQIPGYKAGLFFTTFLAESAVYMKYLTNTFKKRGGIMVKMKIDQLEELTDRFDIVVNCPGVLARVFNKDEDCQPARGQVKAPWVKHFYTDRTESTYIIPVINEVVLGGTKQYNRWCPKTDLKDRAEIIKKTSVMLPSLKGAEVIEDRVGLRPTRSSVRLEREDVLRGNRKIPVIHNYGHGGAGYSLHWGCAQEAARLVVEAAQDTICQSKL